MAQTVKSLPTMQETPVPSLGWEDPLEKEMATHSSVLAWKIPWGGEASWASLWDHTELDTTERLTFSLALAEGSCRSHPGTQVSGPG